MPLTEFNYDEALARWKANEELFPGAGFRRSDDIWSLHFRTRMASTMSSSRVKFASLPPWFVPVAKDFIEFGWWVRDYANLHLIGLLRGVSVFVRYLTECRPEVRSVTDLDGSISSGFEAWLKTDSGLSANAASQAKQRVAVFSAWLTHDAPDAAQVPTSFFIRTGIRGGRRAKAAYMRSEEENREIPPSVMEQLRWAVINEENSLLARITEKPNTSNKARSVLVMLQALKILMLTGRRLSHVLRLKRNPISEPLPGDPPGLRVVFTETKLDLGEQDVFIPHPYDGSVRDAIRLAKQQADWLHPELPKPFLFMGHIARGTPEISDLRFRGWLKKFLRKHEVKGPDETLYHLLPHDARRNRLTALRKSGSTIDDVRTDAVHLGLEMPTIYTYTRNHLHGELMDLHQQQLLEGKGTVFFDERMPEPTVRMKWFTPDEVELVLKGGRRVQKTVYGGCIFPIEDAPCPVYHGDPCWIGEDGGGCRWHVYGPDDGCQIEEDLGFERQQLALLDIEKPRSPLRKHLLNRIQQGEKVLATIRDLKRRRDGAERNG